MTQTVDNLLTHIATDDLAQHCWRVAELAGSLATHMDLPGETVTRITVAGVVHDIGKRAIPAAVINKPAALDAEEWRIMMTHPTLGYEMVMHEVHPDIADAVRSHHERFDGRGYPRGLAGHDIPLAARVLLVADAYDAMTSDRPYQGPLPSVVAQTELQLHAGYQFDPDVVAAMVDLLAGASVIAA